MHYRLELHLQNVMSARPEHATKAATKTQFGMQRLLYLTAAIGQQKPRAPLGTSKFMAESMQMVLNCSVPADAIVSRSPDSFSCLGVWPEAPHPQTGKRVLACETTCTDAIQDALPAQSQE